MYVKTTYHFVTSLLFCVRVTEHKSNEVLQNNAIRIMFRRGLRRVVWWKFTDVSVLLAASIIRAIHGATTQKTEIFILAAVRTCNLTELCFVYFVGLS
jgi:hypothetical protein